MHRQELGLLGCGALFLAANQLGLVIVQNRSVLALWPLVAWGAGALMGWQLLNRWLPVRDPFFYPAAMFLAGWGAVLVDRLLPIYAARQVAWLLMGLAVLLAICRWPLDWAWLRHKKYSWLLLGLTLMLGALAWGINPSGFGPRLWLGFGGFYFQPSEPLKILCVLFLAGYLSEHQAALRNIRPPWESLLALAVMWGACLGLLLWQRDFGTSAIFFLVFLLMLYLASGRLDLLAGGSLLLMGGGFAAYRLVPLVAFRVRIWRDPWSDSDGASFQIVQSLMAIGDGGLFGSGIGQGFPTFIPVVHTDFSYAAIVEEWGLLGGLSALTVLLVIVLRGLRLALHLQDHPFQALVAAGLSLTFAVQSLVIVGGTLNLIPLTGVTLPFVSYGGSSLISSLAALGILLALSRDIAHET